MKKVIKAICCILAAVILVGGGYVAGQRAKQSSIVSALPKNILDIPKESNEPSESAEPESKPSEDVPEPKEDVRIINKSNESAVDSTWSTVETSSNTTDNGAKNINVYVFNGAGTTIKQYTRTETGFSEKSVYESGAVNRVFTTIPSYK